MSHPMWVRGLKLYRKVGTWMPTMSHPMWVRGLKHNILFNLESAKTSHPMWVRGLKLTTQSKPYVSRQVASYVGAWIETHRAKNLDKVW